ncbi:MAG: hypothetical protein ACSLFH_03465 [Desulfuromonadales bacterium]
MIPTQRTLATPYPVGPVHCYSIELAGELVLLDTGPPTAEARTYLQKRQVGCSHCLSPTLHLASRNQQLQPTCCAIAQAS